MQLVLNLTVASSIACSCFLCLVLSSFALSWLAWAALPACAFRSNATQVVSGGFGRNVRTFWVILGLCGLFWAVGVFWADPRKILAGAPCCNGIHFELKL